MADSLAPVELHVWPGAFNLSSIDPACLAAVMYLQLAIRGNYMIVHCTTPENSPSGRLPYISHDLSRVASLSSIMKYVSAMPGFSDPDSSLTSLEKSQQTAWCTHVISNLGDLVAYSFYSSSANYTKVTHPTLAGVLPLPQRYYVPGRIRESYRPRLEAAGLWNRVDPEPTQDTDKRGFGFKNIFKEKEDAKAKMKNAFARQQIVEKATTCFKTWAKLLGPRSFFYHESPSTLDIILSSHILLLLNPRFPDQIISDLLVDSFPSLVIHARLILYRAFQSPSSTPPLRLADSSLSWRALIPRPRLVKENRTEEERRFAKMRWGWIGLALLSTVTYFWMNPIIILVEIQDEGEEEEEEDKEQAEGAEQ